MRHLAFLFFSAVLPVVADTVSLTVANRDFPTYPFGDPDPVPAVKATRYPYFRYDGSSAVAVTQAWRTVTLENDAIRVTILPDVGGKIWGAFDKRSGRDFIYFNHSVKFRDIAMRGPWCSGGIEYNFGIIGHAPSCSTPVDWFTRLNPDGSASCFLASAEYVTRARWQVEVRLAPGADFFETRTTWYNASALEQPYYHWMNAAYSVRGDPRFIFPGSTYIGHAGDAHAWPRDEQGHELDRYSGNAFGGPKSYHVLPGANNVYGIWWPEYGMGSYHRAESYEKYGRKVWLWALSREGGVWEDLLTDEDGQYTELQSGRCFNQERGDTVFTPFKHPVFEPERTETFVERWGVMREPNQLNGEAKKADKLAKRPQVAPDDFDWTSAWGRSFRARQYLLERHDAEAEREFNASLALDPHMLPSLTGLAAIELRRGAFDKVHELCRRALAVNAYDPDAGYLDGVAYFQSGDYVSARDRLGLASFSAKYRAAALSRIARSYLAEGDFAAASRAAAKALAANALDFDAMLVKLVASRGTPSVRSLAESALERFPLFHAARYELQRAGGKEDFRRYVLNELPNQTYLDLAGWYELSGLFDDALTFLACTKDDPISEIRKAYILHRLGNDAAAARALAAARTMPVSGVHPFRAETRPALEWAVAGNDHWKFKYYLGTLLAAFNLDDAAARQLSACDVADDPTAFLLRASLREGEAKVADLRRARELGDSWRVGRALAQHYASVSNYPALLEVASDYVSRYPKCNPIQLAYGNALVKNGRYDDCLEYLRGVVLLPSEHANSGTDYWQEAERGLDPDREVTWPENLGKGRPYSAVTSACDEPRAYELKRAGRVEDDYPPLVDFESPAKWTCVCEGGAVARTRRTNDYQLFGEWTQRLVYRAVPGATNPVVRLVAPSPIPLPNDFDRCTAWVRGTRFGRGANRDPETPEVSLSLDFRLADGTGLTIPFHKIYWKNWFLVDHAFTPNELEKLRGGSFLGFTLAGGVQNSDRLLHFDNVAFFREKKSPVVLKPRAKRNLQPLVNADQGLNTGAGTLPFPTREETSRPDGAEAPVAEGEPVPMFNGGAFFAEDTPDLNMKMTRTGRTLTVDMSGEAGKVRAITLGTACEGRVVKSIPVPYLAVTDGPRRIQVDVLEIPGRKEPWFRLAMFDWYRSNASTVEVRAGKDVQTQVVLPYLPKSDGSRVPVSERVFVTLSPKFEDVLPNIANPPSPYRHIAGTRSWRSQASFDRKSDERLWRSVHAMGMRNVTVTDHESMWRKGGESFTLKTDADPSKGGDEGQRRFTRMMIDELGYVYGPYNNYTDFAPSCPNWRRDWVTRRADGSFVDAWMRCYALRPAAAPEACELIAAEVQRKFGFNTAYCDVHTAIPPWRRDRTDFDARVPGAATFAETFYAWGETLLIQKKIWQGPVWSEGNCQFPSAGLTDGNYGQDWGYRLSEKPWLVDFDLLKIHPLECEVGIGNLAMFAPGVTPLEKSYYLPNAPTPEALTNLIDRFTCATLAFGHTGYLALDYLFNPPKAFGLAYGKREAELELSPAGFAIAMKSYFMVQQIAARYTQSEVALIRYFNAKGDPIDTSTAVATGEYERCQLFVVYRDGTCVVANGNLVEPLNFTYDGNRFTLPPCGYRAWTRNRDVWVDASCGEDGVRADYCESPQYIYIDGRGAMARRKLAVANGTAACLKAGDGWEIAALPGVDWQFRIPAIKARAFALDGKDLGAAEVLRDGEWFSVRPVKGAWRYRAAK